MIESLEINNGKLQTKNSFEALETINEKDDEIVEIDDKSNVEIVVASEVEHSVISDTGFPSMDLKQSESKENGNTKDILLGLVHYTQSDFGFYYSNKATVCMQSNVNAQSNLSSLLY